MRVFTADELTRMQAAQEAAMQDTCYLLVYSTLRVDDYGNPIPSYERSTGYPLACGFKPVSPGEQHGSGEVGTQGAEVRLPLDTDVTNVDRLELVSRFGTELDPHLFYEVAGPIAPGPSGLVASCRLCVKE
jgi:hypothetical protein